MPAAIGYRDFLRDSAIAGSVVVADSSPTGSSNASYPVSNVLDDRRNTVWARENCPSRFGSPASCAQLDITFTANNTQDTTTANDSLPVGLLHLDNVNVFYQTDTGRRLQDFAVVVTVDHTTLGSSGIYNSGTLLYFHNQDMSAPGANIVIPIGFDTAVLPPGAPGSAADNDRKAREAIGGAAGQSSRNFKIRVQIYNVDNNATAAAFTVRVGSVRVMSALCFDTSDAGFTISAVDNSTIVRTNGQAAVANSRTPMFRLSGQMVNLSDEKVFRPSNSVCALNKSTGISKRVVFIPSVWADEEAACWTGFKSQMLGFLALLEQPIAASTVGRVVGGEAFLDASPNGFAWTAPFSLLEVVD